ncbi:type VII toxin-antitoxin system HepT family RNase toxin [Desulfonatronum parangueonense]
MTKGELSKRVVADRVQWIETMISQIRALPSGDREHFFSDPRNALACESCLRRALEALLDLGRHLLAKGFGVAVEEYKEIGTALARHEVITDEQARLFRVMAGYRNRMVHFYHEVSDEELWEICLHHTGDMETVLDAMKHWIRAHQKSFPDTQ